MRLEGSTAVVTGGSRGIGKAVALDYSAAWGRRGGGGTHWRRARPDRGASRCDSDHGRPERSRRDRPGCGHGERHPGTHRHPHQQRSSRPTNRGPADDGRGPGGRDAVQPAGPDAAGAPRAARDDRSPSRAHRQRLIRRGRPAPGEHEQLLRLEGGAPALLGVAPRRSRTSASASPSSSSGPSPAPRPTKRRWPTRSCAASTDGSRPSGSWRTRPPKRSPSDWRLPWSGTSPTSAYHGSLGWVGPSTASCRDSTYYLFRHGS